MAANKSFQESPTLSENAWNWDEIALRILKDSHIDLNDYWRYPLSGRKKHRLKSLKKPRAIPQVILKLQEPRIRESALHLLSSFLFEKREEDPENYYRTGLLLYDSCCTMTILIQELLSVYGMIIKHNLTERSSMRLINILIIFQCIAANSKTRLKLVNSDIPSLLVPIITYWCSLEVYGNVQAVALSVFAILCQARETYVINWALKSSVMEVSILCIHSGNELTKVVGLHIVESILQHRFGIERIYNQFDDRLLMKLLKTLENLVDMMGINKQCYYPRLLFHVLRCYTLLCDHIRGVKVVKMMLPNHLRNRVFRDTLKEYPLICRLHHWLLLILGENTVSLSLHGCA